MYKYSLPIQRLQAYFQDQQQITFHADEQISSPYTTLILWCELKRTNLLAYDITYLDILSRTAPYNNKWCKSERCAPAVLTLWVRKLRINTSYVYYWKPYRVQHPTGICKIWWCVARDITGCMCCSWIVWKWRRVGSMATWSSADTKRISKCDPSLSKS